MLKLHVARPYECTLSSQLRGNIPFLIQQDDWAFLAAQQTLQISPCQVLLYLLN